MGVLVSATVVVFGTRDVVFDRGIIDVAARIAENTDKGTKDGIIQSGSRYVSGSPHSLVAWDDLGYEGRNFTGSSLSARRISQVTGKRAIQPVRAYVGQESAPDFASRARLAVRELERTGAFDREVLAIAGTTGRGWVNSTDAEPLEYMYGGDTAIVAVQYSYLPSWVSFLVDKEQAGRANRALVKAVRARWLEQRPDKRPELVVFGESLGAYGIEAAFDGPDDLLAKVDGALLAGPPNFSPVRRELTRHRDPGSPVWRPVYKEGATSASLSGRGRTCVSPARSSAGRDPARSICKTPRTRSCGGRRTWRSTRPAGCASRWAPTSRTRSTGSRW